MLVLIYPVSSSKPLALKSNSFSPSEAPVPEWYWALFPRQYYQAQRIGKKLVMKAARRRNAFQRLIRADDELTARTDLPYLTVVHKNGNVWYGPFDPVFDIEFAWNGRVRSRKFVLHDEDEPKEMRIDGMRDYEYA